MGRISALEYNGLKEGTKKHNTYMKYVRAIEDIITKTIYSKNFTEFRRNKLIDNLENTSDINFDIGKVDNLQLLNFLKSNKSSDKELTLMILNKAHGEINPKDYGYGIFNLENL